MRFAIVDSNTGEVLSIIEGNRETIQHVAVGGHPKVELSDDSTTNVGDVLVREESPDKPGFFQWLKKVL